jgi:two-component sensor histidine kinase
MTRVFESLSGVLSSNLFPNAAEDSLGSPPMAEALRSRGLAFVDSPSDLRAALEAPQALIELLPMAACACDAEGRILWFNGRAAMLWGRRPALGEAYVPDLVAGMLKTGSPVRGAEEVILRPDGTTVRVVMHVDAVRDAQGVVLGAISLMTPLSDDQNFQKKQDVMLNELNHRVKNNMQMMSALLKGAEREAATPEGRMALADAGHRIAAMVTAQQVLYDSGRGASFDARALFGAACERTGQALGIDFEIACDAISADLSNDAAIPLALIVNELLTNAAQHGMAGRAGGTVRLVFAPAEGGGHVLSIEDEGPGFVFTPGRKRSSGLGLVSGLARQLGGRLEVVPGPGGRVRVHIA